MANYSPVIGLEIHAELKTKTKMFCDCLNDPAEKHPNTNVCAICLGHPGTLPTINKAAVESILKIGIALNGDIPQFSKFDRKNYFYPDLPKGYQISQYDLPLVFGGILNGVRLRRVHLEEDTGRLVHSHEINSLEITQSASLVDFNRAGVPLMELVTEPDIKNAEQAVEFARELQLILRYLGVSDADMERGQMRIEANVSLAKISDTSNRSQSSAFVPGTKVEVKNINSFKAVHDAIEYEIKRQKEILESGGKVVQETRGWNEHKQATVSQRLKEEAHDYRYFPEPDLPPLDLSQFNWQELKLSVPELPQAKRTRFIKEFSLTPEQANLIASNRNWAEYFEEVISEVAEHDSFNLKEKIVLAFNYFTSDLQGLMMMRPDMTFSDLKINPEDFADLILLIASQKVSSRSAKDILKKMFDTGLDPNQILSQERLEQISDEAALKQIAEEVVKENTTAIADYRKGKTAALQFLIGKAMAKLRGRGNPEILLKIFKDLLG